MARTKNSGSDVLSIKSAKHKSVSGDASNANDVKSVKSVKSAKKNAKAAKRSSSSTATSASGHRLGVAAVALASTLSMVLPGAAASARTSFNPDSFDPSYVNSVLLRLLAKVLGMAPAKALVMARAMAMETAYIRMDCLTRVLLLIALCVRWLILLRNI